MKRIFAAITAALMMVALVASTTIAAPPTSDLMTQAWRIQYAKPATSSFWDINKVKLVDGELSFPVQEYLSKTTGSFAVYFQNNYNVSLTAGQTLSATANWTPGIYETRSTPSSAAFGRFWFQSAIGNYDSNDYWWYSGDTLALNGTSNDDTMTAPLSNRAGWSNICGQLATDTVAHPGPNCIGGTDPDVSPYDGFTNAMANVKQLGISFGSASRYASGVAFVGGPATFSVSAFTVTQ